VLLTSPAIFYLTQEHFRTQSNRLKIVSRSGVSVAINKLMLVAFSKKLHKPLEELESNCDETVIITDLSQEELEMVVNFCSEGILPKPLEELKENIPNQISSVFWNFGINLSNVLFDLQSEQEEEQLKTEEETAEQYSLEDEDDHDHDFIKDEPIPVDVELVEEMMLSEHEPPLKKARRQKTNKVLKNSQKSSKSESSSSSEISHWRKRQFEHHTEIQEKYKDFIKVCIPNITDSPDIKYDDYIPSKPLESYFIRQRPESRKKKLPLDHDKLPFMCEHCPRRFPLESNKIGHETKYHSSHYQCPYCKNVFPEEHCEKFKKHLYKHEHVSKTFEPHECIQCGMRDYILPALETHINKLRGPFHNNQCTQCEDRFRSHDEYKEHVNLCHEGNWRYRCDNCEIVFDTLKASKEHRLEAHKRRYIPKKLLPSVCDTCGKVMKATRIARHMRLVHMNENQKTKCPQCGIYVKEVQRHINQVHVKIPCELCGKLVMPGTFKTHNDQFHTAPEKRRYKCDVCGLACASSFKLKDHANIHTGEKPYDCEHCGVGFSSSTGRRSHVRYVHLGHKRNRKPK
jgi:hypothetical protein